jgi:hypothetical protein
MEYILNEADLEFEQFSYLNKFSNFKFWNFETLKFWNLEKETKIENFKMQKKSKKIKTKSNTLKATGPARFKS